jgi:hypothetical protein
MKKVRYTIQLNLYEDDFDTLREKAGAYGLTIPELLENFAADLVSSKHKRSFYATDLADAWYEQCRSCGEGTLLRYLIEWESPELFVEYLDDIQQAEANIKEYEENLQTGYPIGRNGEKYSWDTFIDANGDQLYANIEEWQADVRNDIEYARETIKARKGSIQDTWEHYLDHTDAPEEYEAAVRRVRGYLEQREADE